MTETFEEDQLDEEEQEKSEFSEALDEDLGEKKPETKPAPAAKTPEYVNVFADEGYEFSQTQITIGISMLPEKEGEHTRQTVIGIRNKDETPIIRMVAISRPDQIMPVIYELIEEMKKQLPGRQQADARRKEEAEKQNKELKERQAKSKVAKSEEEIKAEKEAAQKQKEAEREAAKKQKEEEREAEKKRKAEEKRAVELAGQMSIFDMDNFFN